MSEAKTCPADEDNESEPQDENQEIKLPPYEEEPTTEQLWEEILKAIPSHPPTAECPEPECILCSIRDCPSSCELHYHHDGCPSCTLDAEGE